MIYIFFVHFLPLFIKRAIRKIKRHFIPVSAILVFAVNSVNPVRVNHTPSFWLIIAFSITDKIRAIFPSFAAYKNNAASAALLTLDWRRLAPFSHLQHHLKKPLRLPDFLQHTLKCCLNQNRRRFLPFQE